MKKQIRNEKVKFQSKGILINQEVKGNLQALGEQDTQRAHEHPRGRIGIAPHVDIVPAQDHLTHGDIVAHISHHHAVDEAGRRQTCRSGDGDDYDQEPAFTKNSTYCSKAASTG